MRVLMFVQRLAPGGAQRMTLHLARHLPAAGWTPILVAGTRAEGSPDPQGGIELGVGRARRAVLPLARIIRERRPDALFAPTPESSIALALAWRFAGRRGALILRESNHRTGQRFPRWSPFSLLLRWAYRQAHVVVGCSRGVAEDLVARYGLAPARVAVIPNPIDTAWVLRRAQEAAPPSWGGEGSDVVRVLAAGRLVHQKGFDILLRAVARLADRGISLAILGDGPERGGLAALADRLGLARRVRFVGSTANPFAWMAATDVFVLSSRWEGFPNVLVEAMTCGAAVVATRCPGSPAEIVEHEEDGLLCDPEDPVGLSEQIARLVADAALRRKLGDRAREAVRRFEASEVAARYATVFRNAVTLQPADRI